LQTAKGVNRYFSFRLVADIELGKQRMYNTYRPSQHEV